ncbi:hemolysin III family protein [Gordonia sp. CPCC 205515]|uniref:PAQR family membrane homeostasis protein TrhA n=1 Tax=Gordonia sp. CPCC 205515 TaxID=3140791 RepID=UPI003AF33B5A
MSILTDALPVPLRPRLRGVIHHYSAMVATLAGVAVVVGAAILDGTGAALACAIYAVTVVGLFTVSATYHRIAWKTPRAYVRMKRADHSMIFVFIAGSYTPFCVLALPVPERWWVLGIVWAGAAAGVALKLMWPAGPRWLSVALYVTLGWVIVVVAPTLVAHSGLDVAILLALGGLFYSIGAIAYALRWPNPWPTTFGHHEIFHACTVIAALLHYIAVWLVVVG